MYVGSHLLMRKKISVKVNDFGDIYFVMEYRTLSTTVAVSVMSAVGARLPWQIV